MHFYQPLGASLGCLTRTKFWSTTGCFSPQLNVGPNSSKLLDNVDWRREVRASVNNTFFLIIINQNFGRIHQRLKGGQNGPFLHYVIYGQLLIGSLSQLIQWFMAIDGRLQTNVTLRRVTQSNICSYCDIEPSLINIIC